MLVLVEELRCSCWLPGTEKIYEFFQGFGAGGIDKSHEFLLSFGAGGGAQVPLVAPIHG